MTAYILDTETDAKNNPKVIQLAYLNLDTQAEFMAYYHSGRKICPATMAVHHISDDDVADKPLFDPKTLPNMAYMIGHNIDYDWKAVNEPSCKRICTLALARSLFPEWSGFSQGACVYHILPAAQAKKLTKDAHDALADVKANLVLYQHICKTLNVAENDYEAVWQASEAARIPKTMPFGKHRGTPMNELPASYINWALNNLTDIDDYMKKALELAQAFQQGR